jgi:tetratricopeptide (TPR) repeat protein
MAAYRAGNYGLALRETDELKHGTSKSPAYFFFRGTMLHKLGRFDEAESSLRDGLLLQPDDRSKALSYNTLAEVLMDQERFEESIAAYRTAGKLWPERGSNLRGIAEVWLRQGQQLLDALDSARQAVEVDKSATGMPKELLDQRLGEDFAVLAWAIAANSGDSREIESLLTEAFSLCAKTKPVLGQVHYHAGRAYAALGQFDKCQAHFHHAAEIDSQGGFGRLARAELS